ncbi:class II aldolase/adducin family protein [Rhodococcus opacus]|uniref:class II aldolase/adducin family protein n=1 Tax=Rhodococcus opacus TaxID=37919 RepID=UPI000AC1B598|nr:class II aldolase/adducin family protein [Rhodococcus opacus]
MDNDLHRELIDAARVLAQAGLVDAFGHVSVRTSPSTALLTPPRPLGSLGAGDSPLALTTDSDELPAGAPKEAWLHLAVMERDSNVGAVCRAQPRAVAAIAALGRVPAALNGHAAMLGPVALHPDSQLVRNRGAAEAIAESAGSSQAVILRGNGAVTWGRDIAEAVARMWILERSAELDLRASAAGSPIELPTVEQEWWRERASELLPRLYRYLETLLQDQHRPSLGEE